MPGGLYPPLSISQSWPTPNYQDAVTQGTALIDLAIALYAIAFVTVVARLWARVVVTYDVGLDDVLVVVAMARAGYRSSAGFLKLILLDSFDRPCDCNWFR